MKTVTKLGIGLGVLALLSPVGLFLPRLFKTGPAWGEWSPGEVRKLIGYIPAGLEKLSLLWSAAMPAYSFGGSENKGAGPSGLAYVVSAAAGIVLCALSAWLLGKLLARP